MEVVKFPTDLYQSSDFYTILPLTRVSYFPHEQKKIPIHRHISCYKRKIKHLHVVGCATHMHTCTSYSRTDAESGCRLTPDMNVTSPRFWSSPESQIWQWHPRCSAPLVKFLSEVWKSLSIVLVSPSSFSLVIYSGMNEHQWDTVSKSKF